MGNDDRAIQFEQSNPAPEQHRGIDMALQPWSEEDSAKPYRLTVDTTSINAVICITGDESGQHDLRIQVEISQGVPHLMIGTGATGDSQLLSAHIHEGAVYVETAADHIQGRAMTLDDLTVVAPYVLENMETPPLGDARKARAVAYEYIRGGAVFSAD